MSESKVGLPLESIWRFSGNVKIGAKRRKENHTDNRRRGSSFVIAKPPVVQL